MKNIIFCLLLFVSFISTIQIHSINAQNANTENPSTQESVSQENADSQRIVKLETQVELIDRYNGKILDAIYWSLASLLTVLIVVIGLGWYTNFRIYRKDVDAIRNEITTNLEQAKASFKTEMTGAAAKAGEKAVQDSIREIKKLQYEVLKLEAKGWEEQKVFANVIFAYARGISTILGVHDDLYISEILDRILKTLKTNEIILTSNIVSRLNQELESVPKEFATDVEAIRKLVSDIRAKTS